MLPGRPHIRFTILWEKCNAPRTRARCVRVLNVDHEGMIWTLGGVWYNGHAPRDDADGRRLP